MSETQEANHHALDEATPGAVGVDDNPEAGSADGLAVEHLADAPERSLLSAADAAARAGTPLRIRTALQVWNPEVKPYGAFRGWRGQSWLINVPGIDAAKKFRQLIELVFDLVRLFGIDQSISLIEAAIVERGTIESKIHT